MPLSYTEMKNAILDYADGDAAEWYKVLGAMFEATKGFSTPAAILVNTGDQKYKVTWNNYDWYIEEA